MVCVEHDLFNVQDVNIDVDADVASATVTGRPLVQIDNGELRLEVSW